MYHLNLVIIKFVFLDYWKPIPVCCDGNTCDGIPLLLLFIYLLCNFIIYNFIQRVKTTERHGMGSIAGVSSCSQTTASSSI